MFMQVFIERARRISRDLGYSPLILRGGELSSIQISALIDGKLLLTVSAGCPISSPELAGTFAGSCCICWFDGHTLLAL